MARCRYAIVVVLVSGPAWATPPSPPWHGETLASVGVCSGTLHLNDSRASIAGASYGLTQVLNLAPSLELRLAYESDKLAPDNQLLGVVDSASERTLLRAGLKPQFHAGNALLSVSVEAVSLHTVETGRTAFGTKDRVGFGVGGGSLVRLGPHMEVLGEASGYSLGDIEMISAGMRISYRFWQRDGRALALHVEAREEQWSGGSFELDGGNVEVGVGWGF